MMTRAQEVAIATAVQQVRPDWDHPASSPPSAPRKAWAHLVRSLPRHSGLRVTSKLHARLLPAGSHWRAPAEGTDGQRDRDPMR